MRHLIKHLNHKSAEHVHGKSAAFKQLTTKHGVITFDLPLVKLTTDTYKTTQTSGNSTIDLYWNFVNYKLHNIVLCGAKRDSYDWEEIFSDIRFGISHCDIELKYHPNNQLAQVYKAQFISIRKQLESL